MARFLILLALIWLGFMAYRALKRKTRSLKASNPAAHSNEEHRMVRCAQCQLHIPEPDAVRHGADHFCCQAHRVQYLQRNDRH
ncbi:PP0621 family protein [Larsenimonas suaedae]|uniref:PP0621 family protein n=1 Tax=Larsenimonas suaedae TaxID=1851019 RepID=A0ABU1GYM6_9GAMM|nr:PP0621 family protein [Larsenimonas suaedae]MCM2973711.1 hypothetical protein [Larsenimonas suaedae]MDR5897155.1 PP0621 family protein [Larsenimonas suaedae]